MCTQNKFLLRVWKFISRICLGPGPFNTSQFKKKMKSIRYIYKVNLIQSINNGNRSEWSPIWSVIIRGINKIGRPQCGSLIC